LTGSASKINDKVIPGKVKRVYHRVHDRGWIAAPIPLVEVDDFATESAIHRPTMSIRISGAG
jgi:hypothetical protein